MGGMDRPTIKTTHIIKDLPRRGGPNNAAATTFTGGNFVPRVQGQPVVVRQRVRGQRRHVGGGRLCLKIFVVGVWGLN